jgi:flavin reductase (DIM6/NTAB) family NADH-FMN oxidoreductase RutF
VPVIAPSKPIDPDTYRRVLALHPGGVAIVTAMESGPTGRPVGLTVTAFCAVSADPPLVLVCVDAGSNTLPAIRASGAFTVNLVAAGHEDTALAFASKNPDKFAAVSWRDGADGHLAPVLDEVTTAHLACQVENEVEAGDHLVFIGRVLRAELGDHDRPLVYHGRRFVDLGPEESRR